MAPLPFTPRGNPTSGNCSTGPSIKRFAPNVDVKTVQIETMHAGVQKIAMDHLAGAYKDMPDVIMLDTVGIVNLVDAGLLLDMTEYWEPIAHEFVEGAEPMPPSTTGYGHCPMQSVLSFCSTTREISRSTTSTRP